VIGRNEALRRCIHRKGDVETAAMGLLMRGPGFGSVAEAALLA